MGLRISLDQILDTYEGNVEVLRPLIARIKSCGFPPIILIVNPIVKNNKNLFSPISEQAYLVQAAKMACHELKAQSQFFINCELADSPEGYSYKICGTVLNNLERFNRIKYMTEKLENLKKTQKHMCQMAAFQESMCDTTINNFQGNTPSDE